jgi:hypothetical protein
VVKVRSDRPKISGLSVEISQAAPNKRRVVIKMGRRSDAVDFDEGSEERSKEGQEFTASLTKRVDRRGTTYG